MWKERGCDLRRNLKQDFEIVLDLTGERHEYLSRNSPSSGGNLNPVPPECEAVVLPLDRDVLVSILLGRDHVPG
jgi:hypothetical protein